MRNSNKNFNCKPETQTPSTTISTFCRGLQTSGKSSSDNCGLLCKSVAYPVRRVLKVRPDTKSGGGGGGGGCCRLRGGGGGGGGGCCRFLVRYDGGGGGGGAVVSQARRTKGACPNGFWKN